MRLALGEVGGAARAGCSLRALRSAFDSGGDGELNASDAELAEFKVLVTKADGATEVKKPVQGNGVEIDLEGVETPLLDGNVYLFRYNQKPV